MKILFLLKGNSGYGYGGPKSGLLESAKLTADQLEKQLHLKVKVFICVDGNDIDREIFLYKPTICIIEAIWVTPEKLKEVSLLHPKVKFYIRIHSEISFLATEGVAIDWIKQYIHIANVHVSFNSHATNNDFLSVVGDAIYLPNIYHSVKPHSVFFLEELFSSVKNHLNIGCFGAIRPLKNQLVQAFAAIEYANDNGKIIHFHINSARTEQGGESVLKNIRSLFKGSKHKLIEHRWLTRSDFFNLIKSMDIGLQVSFSESFNIVTADFVLSEVPMIVSHAIKWMPDDLKVKNDVEEISERIKHILHFTHFYSALAKKYLNNYNIKAIEVWEDFLKTS